MITAPIYPNNYVVFDFETSGLDPVASQVIQMSALKVVNGLPSERFNRFVRARKKLDTKIVELTGITDEKLADEGVEPNEAWELFGKFIGKWALVGHNSIRLFLEEAVKAKKLDKVGISRHIDTAMLYKAWKMGERQRYFESHFMFATRIGMTRAKGVYFKLTLCMEELNIDCTQFTAHQSDSDCEMTNLLYRKITRIDQS